MNDAGDAYRGRTLSALLDLHADRQPITGRLRTEWGGDERFVGWLGFIDALKKLSEQQSALAGPAADAAAQDEAAVRPQHSKESTS
jgi:hypothetical protein